MLKVKNVSKQYRGEDKLLFDAVSDVSLSMEDHCIYALVGESGCGKSTLSRLILGLESLRPVKSCWTENRFPAKGKGIGKKQQKQSNWYCRTEKALSTLILRFIRRLPNQSEICWTCRRIKSRPEFMLDRMGLPKETANKKTGELSGGQQKRIGIARALAVSPRYIVFDESISGLDVILRKSILELLKKVQEEEQCSYLFITHEIDAALYLADEIHVMQNGKLIESRGWSGDLKIFQNPYTKQLLRASHLI